MDSATTEDQDESTHLLEAEKEKPATEKPPIWFSKRLLVIFVLFFCYINSATINSNVNIAIVEMTSNKTIIKGNLTITKEPEFHWDSTTAGVILSAYSYGALLSFFGSVPVKIFGGSRSCAISVLIMGLTTLLEPVLLCLNFYLFLFCRFVTGLFQAFFIVSTAEIYSRWIPNNERSTLVSYSYNGVNVGYTISPAILGFLAQNWGWRIIFYATGTVSVILSIIFFILVKNQPSEDKGISEKELLYIQTETSTTTRANVSHQYKKIFLSAPIWALLILQFVVSWVPTLLNAYFPMYVKDLTQKNTDEVGLISSIPMAVQIVMFPAAGILMDKYRIRNNTSNTKIHKIFLSVALLTSSVLFVAIVAISDFVLSLVIFVIIQVFVSSVHLIVQLIVVNIAPNDTSVVAGLSSFSQAISSIVSRLMTGFMITNHSLQEWNNCFLVMAIVLLFGAVTFLVYGSSEAQSWSLNPPDEVHQSDEH